MRFFYTTDETVFLVKALAKKLGKTSNCNHHEALAQASALFGYASYEHLVRCLKHWADASFQGPPPSHLLTSVPKEAEGLHYRQDLSRFDMKLSVDRNPGLQSLIAAGLADGVLVSHDLRYILFASSPETYGEDFDDFSVVD